MGVGYAGEIESVVGIFGQGSYIKTSVDPVLWALPRWHPEGLLHSASESERSDLWPF